MKHVGKVNNSVLWCVAYTPSLLVLMCSIFIVLKLIRIDNYNNIDIIAFVLSGVTCVVASPVERYQGDSRALLKHCNPLPNNILPLTCSFH
jgi:hypothetical protein